jgi:hypothetical protein
MLLSLKRTQTQGIQAFDGVLFLRKKIPSSNNEKE